MLFLLLTLFLLAVTTARADVLDELQVGHWVEIPNSKIRPVCASPLGMDCGGVTAFSGAFVDTQRKLFIVHGGGHGDYAGNEFYAFALTADDATHPQFTWKRIWGPTANEFIPPISTTTAETYANGDPASVHTYSSIWYLPNVDRYFRHGGSLWSSGGFGRATWLWNPNNSTWSQQTDISTQCAGAGDGQDNAAGYDPNRGRVYVFKGNALCEFNPVTNSWIKRGPGGAFINDQSMTVFDHHRKQLCHIGNGFVRCADMSNDANNSIAYTNLSTTGDQTCQNHNKPGAQYDPVLRQIPCWPETGTDIYLLDLATRIWTKVAAAAGNEVTPADGVQTYGRFAYLPSRNVYLLVNSVDQNVYAYRLSAAPHAPSNLRVRPCPPRGAFICADGAIKRASQ